MTSIHLDLKKPAAGVTRQQWQRILRRFEFIVRERQKGLTMVEIAKKCGVTKQRVEQILKRLHLKKKFVRSGFMFLEEVGKQCGRTPLQIGNLCRTYGIKTRNGQILIGNAKRILSTLRQPCSACGKALNRMKSKWGVHHKCLTMSWRWRNIPGFKEKHVKTCEAWRKRNPEKARIIQARAYAAYVARQKQ